MLAAILEASGLKVIYNSSGSNLSRGIASFLSLNSNLLGTKVNADIGIFEVDEATMPEITGKISPRLIIVTNLFRDQLDRYGELNKTAEIIGSAIDKSPQSTVLLNGDDPLVADLKKFSHKIRYFGIDEPLVSKSTGAIDSKICLHCGHELDYEYRYFGHLGRYQCPNCGYKKPDLDYKFTKLDLKVDESTALFKNNSEKEDFTIKTKLPGLYNLYNALAACAIASELGIKTFIIQTALEQVSAAFGRMETIAIGKKRLALLLVKNPTGFTQVIETLTYDKKPKNLFLILNDKFADGTDISWIWDAELEMINRLTKNVTVSGLRAEDMLLRLKYADFDLKQILLEKNIALALAAALEKTNDNEVLYVLPTYTAMLELRKILFNRGLVKGLVE